MASRTFRQFINQELGAFPHFVIYAILEWIMIILLFIDGFLAFISNEFAKFFELQIPCLLCTRIDHLLVCRNSNFYYNESICEDHKRDISSLAYCHVHRKLSDIRSMCEVCLLSLAAAKESDGDTYKSLVGILHKDIDCFVEDDPRVKLISGKRDEVMQVEKSGSVHRCSCCGEPLKVRCSSKAMVHSSSINGSILSQAPTPSPRAPFVSWRNEEARHLELPHVRYTELKFMSDNESELPDDDDGSNIDASSCKEDVKAATVPLLPETEDVNEDACKTPIFARGNRFFGIPLTDSPLGSPRFASRFPRKFPIEKSELFSDAVDVNTTHEPDGDSVLTRLKRQVRIDRKSLVELYMELDEERSASAVAANNAMAMITRLQAEKAAVQMEALQYQRMMEEQAEYDQEALQVMKNLLSKTEEEVKNLESELEVYREKYGQIKRVGSEDCEVDADEDYQEMKYQSFSSRSGSDSPDEVDHNGSEPNSGRYGLSLEENGGETTEESSLGFESERSHLLGLLTDLEKRYYQCLDDGSRVSPRDTDKVNYESEDKEHGNNASLTREVCHIRDRLKAIEADSGFLKHAAMTLQKGGEGTKVLTEIAHNLRNLRELVKIPLEEIETLF